MTEGEKELAGEGKDHTICWEVPFHVGETME